jgi:hypothetical protein
LVDPDKWDFYAMDASRLAGDDERAEQQGIMPAGPGAGELTEFFAHVDDKLGPTASEATGSPRVQRNDREVLNLLSKRARTLHLGVCAGGQ